MHAVNPKARFRKADRETRLEFARRREIMLAGWENDTKLRDELGNYERATWEAGRCAADLDHQHSYVGWSVGAPRSRCGSWSEDVEAFRADMLACANVPVPA